MIVNIAVGTKGLSQVNIKLFVSPADSVSTPRPTDADADVGPLGVYIYNCQKHLVFVMFN